MSFGNTMSAKRSTARGNLYAVPAAGQAYVAPAGEVAFTSNIGACRIGETPTSCTARLTRELSGGTTGSTTTPTTPTTTTGVNQTQLFNTISGLIGVSGQAISTAITTGAQVEIARINAASVRAVAEIQARMQGTTNPAEQAGFAAQIAALQAVIAQTGGAKDNTALYVALGVGVLAIGGIAFMATRPRRNPVVRSRKTGKKRYVKPGSRRRGKRKSRR